MFSNFKYYLRILYTPTCWNRLYRSDKRLDDIIVRAINRGEIRIEDNYYAVIGGYRLWTENYPYCYGHPAADIYKHRRLPSRVAVFKLRDALKRLGAVNSEEQEFLDSLHRSRVK